MNFVNLFSKHSSCDMNTVSILFTTTAINKMLQFLADKLTLGKASAELKEVAEPAVSIGCHKLRNI